MTKWLTDMVAAVPPDFKAEASMGYALPNGAEILGPLPDETRPLLLAFLYLGETIAKREREAGTPSATAWERVQLKTLGLLVTTSVHHHFGILDVPIGVGPDANGALIALKLPLWEHGVKKILFASF